MDRGKSALGKREGRSEEIESTFQRKKYDLELVFYNDNPELITLIPPMKGFSWKNFLESYFKSEK